MRSVAAPAKMYPFVTKNADSISDTFTPEWFFFYCYFFILSVKKRKKKKKQQQDFIFFRLGERERERPSKRIYPAHVKIYIMRHVLATGANSGLTIG